MNNKQNKWMKEYSNELKIIVVNEYLNGVPSTVLAKKYDIRNPNLIRQWKAKYLTNGKDSILNMKKQGSGRSVKPKTESLEDKVKRLELENMLLKKYHELLMEEETKPR